MVFWMVFRIVAEENEETKKRSWKIWMHLPMSGDVLSNAEKLTGRSAQGFCYCHFRKDPQSECVKVVIYHVIYNSFVGVVAYLGSVVLSFLRFSLCNFTRNSAWARCIGGSFCAANVEANRIQHNSALVSSRDHLSGSCWFLFAIHGYWSKPWHLVNPKIAGKWMFIPLELIIIGFDPPPHISEPWHKVTSESISRLLKKYLAMFGRFQDCQA